jgi:hypothetical protein
MTTATETFWTELRPPLIIRKSREVFVEHARALWKIGREEEREQLMEEARAAFEDTLRRFTNSDRQLLLAAGLVVTDLAMQGWELRVRGGRVKVHPPVPVNNDRSAEKERIRRQELLKRDAQLRRPAVNSFLRSMERSQFFNGRLTSIFSLMRDGRELAKNLRRAREHINNGWATVVATVTDPYLQFVSSDDATCSFTGLRLMDIWRYFRHTWTTQYTSVPGRTMTFLVRDRAAPFHPVFGIGALSSPVMQIRERDTWIGWHPDTFLARVKSCPTDELAAWLVAVVDAAITEIYIEDLLSDDVISTRDLSAPSDTVSDRLMNESAEQRRLHYRYVRSRDHKVKISTAGEDDFWVERAKTHLFRSKRALALASYLRARSVLNDDFGRRPTAEKLVALARTNQGNNAIRKILKKAKADRVGIAVADISVCGAVQPYNAILGGKLVAMLAASPEVVLEYRRRYTGAESEIASSMAGRPIVRSPTLALLGTTSLYGVGSSQYNRVKIPCKRLGGSPNDSIRYEELGHSEAFGTSQYSEETVDALADLVQQSENGRRVNSIFGEGVSPKLRKVREGLDRLGFPSELLLRHHRPRVVYAVSLVRNLRDHLLGIDPMPRYLVAMDNGAAATARIAAWWRERWLRNRIMSDEVLAAIERQTLVHPIRHGARVTRPRDSDQQLLFGEPF